MKICFGIAVMEKLKRTSTTLIAAKYGVHVRTVQRVWYRAKNCKAQGIPIDVGSMKPKNGGRKKIEVDLSRVTDIPLNRRGTIRSVASALDVKKSTLHRWFKAGMLQQHSSSLKPYLKEENKKARLQWCLSMLDKSTLPHDPKFVEMEDIIHSDEKWFNGTKKNKTMYMHPDEDDPHRTVQNKNAIHKVMFYSSVAKPRFDDEGRCYFDGKLGI
jgi:transposase-like protein